MPPDFVIFAKKMQVSGFYYNPAYKPNYPYQVFNTYMGDHIKLIVANKVLKIIEEDDLINNAMKQGDLLKRSLESLSYLSMTKNVRGQGLFIAFDGITPEISDMIAEKLEICDVIIGRCGVQRSIQLRPSLIFGDEERKFFIDILQDIIVHVRKNVGNHSNVTY